MPPPGVAGAPSGYGNPLPLIGHGRKAIRAKRSLAWLLPHSLIECVRLPRLPIFALITNKGKKKL